MQIPTWQLEYIPHHHMKTYHVTEVTGHVQKVYVLNQVVEKYATVRAL